MFTGVLVLLLDWWWQVKLIMPSLFFEALLHQLFAEAEKALFHAYNITIGAKCIISNTGGINGSSCIAKTSVLNYFKFLSLSLI